MYQERLSIPRFGDENNDSNVLGMSAEELQELQELLRIFDEYKPLTPDDGVPRRWKTKRTPTNPDVSGIQMFK